jgi:pimeloyl-ACP methyl ester carboxylesterase
MALVGWSGFGMEMAAYTIRHPRRVTRLLQVSPVPPSARLFQQLGGDARVRRRDTIAIAVVDRRFREGGFAGDTASYCRARNRLTVPASFADTARWTLAADPCRFPNEWPPLLNEYFGAFGRSLADFDWLDDIGAVTIPRLVIHGCEDGIPRAGARAWVAGFPNARLLVLSPAGHFPFIERSDAFFSAADAFLAGDWPPGAETIAPS